MEKETIILLIQNRIRSDLEKYKNLKSDKEWTKIIATKIYNDFINNETIVEVQQSSDILDNWDGIEHFRD